MFNNKVLTDDIIALVYNSKCVDLFYCTGPWCQVPIPSGITFLLLHWELFSFKPDNQVFTGQSITLVLNSNCVKLLYWIGSWSQVPIHHEGHAHNWRRLNLELFSFMFEINTFTKHKKTFVHNTMNVRTVPYGLYCKHVTLVIYYCSHSGLCYKPCYYHKLCC